MGIFNHVQIKIKDLKTSSRFYGAIMEILGYSIVLNIKDKVIGYGNSTHDMFEIYRADEKAHLPQSVHIAFNASNKESVDAFYRMALENGGQGNGNPGFRPEYEEGYYAAFVIDPDGNNIEAVYSEKRQNLKK